MAENVYEGMFILDSNRYGRDPAGVSGQIPSTIEEAGGKMLASRLWEERRLAYPISGQRKGTYWLTYFQLEGDKLTNMNRQFQLNENVIRSLFLKVDPRIVETLVTHANAGTLPSAERRAAAAAKAPPEVVAEVGLEVPELEEE